MEEDYDGTYKCDYYGKYGFYIDSNGNLTQDVYEDEYGELEDALE